MVALVVDEAHCVKTWLVLNSIIDCGNIEYLHL